MGLGEQVMKRRSLLIGSGGLMLAAALGGCQSQTTGLRVDLLQESIPTAVLTDLQQQIRPTALQVRSVRSLDALYQALRTYHQVEATEGDPPKPSQRADILSLADGWLTSAIRESLIQPLTLQQVSGWDRLPEPWRKLVLRNSQGLPDTKGSIWAAPYRWGSLAIAYRKDKLKQPPTDWSDLWQPELTGRISLPDQARAVLGLTLKYLGHSVNTTDLGAIADLPDALAALNKQARFYSSTTYLEPLILGDTSVAVGWSMDIVPLLKKNPRLGAVVPQSGTILTSDLWVLPAAPKTASSETTTVQSLIDTWVQYYWRPEVATRLTLLGSGASPVLLDGRTELPSSLKNAFILPDATIVKRSEFLEPLSASTAETYRRLWTAMREA
ncbi:MULTISPECIES: extracellular solute-binding protein [unclassified Leptolyngbya]|uniref:extracellular solute-binding protein n=1 Tax=unclassified Leptolyngbya TaxID=2650499 RepID=UPI001686FE15|nr:MULTISPECIES: extracellular solute-binding protein [unclassified Leptolyngbya]MBD1910313.1 extracellular solute-binding protein [Leptolyngbya sp. FACHB-8]MBD2155775.1 extracellular solute-binding protein [Leptolyngbya sp. FACHB-16]